MVSRFLLYLHLYYNPHLYTPMTILSRYMRSISSSRKTCIHLSSSHHVMTYTVIGYISSCSLSYTPSISLTTPYYHTHSSIFVSGNSPLLASLQSITPSSHCLSPNLTQTSLYLLDHYHLKIDRLGDYTCLIILIHTTSSSPTPISLAIIMTTYLLGPSSNRIMDIGYISLISALGIVGIKVATILQHRMRELCSLMMGYRIGDTMCVTSDVHIMRACQCHPMISNDGTCCDGQYQPKGLILTITSCTIMMISCVDIDM